MVLCRHLVQTPGACQDTKWASLLGFCWFHCLSHQPSVLWAWDGGAEVSSAVTWFSSSVCAGFKNLLARPLPSRWYLAFLLFTSAPVLEGEMLLPHYALGFCLAPAHQATLWAWTPLLALVPRSLDLGSTLRMVSPFILFFPVAWLGVRGHLHFLKC